jgi:hypothetical protein
VLVLIVCINTKNDALHTTRQHSGTHTRAQQQQRPLKKKHHKLTATPAAVPKAAPISGPKTIATANA